MRELLLTIHILAAAVWVGGGLYSTVSFRRHVANAGLRKTLAVDEALGSRFFGTAMAVLLLSGILLVTTSDVFGWGSTFVIIGISAIVAEGILQGAVFAPATKKLAETGHDDGSTPPLITWSAAASLTLAVIALWAMVAKLGA